MANISEEKWIEMLEKKADGTYIAKYPKVKSKSGVTFDEHLADNTNPHNVTKSQVGLSKVENMSATEIRTAANRSLKVEVVSSSVSETPDAGRIIFDTSQGKFFGGNGTEWV